MQILNWSLLREPLNWIIVGVMLAFGVMALKIISPVNPLSPQGSSTDGS
jgi:hypothetical protein